MRASFSLVIFAATAIYASANALASNSFQDRWQERALDRAAIWGLTEQEALSRTRTLMSKGLSSSQRSGIPVIKVGTDNNCDFFAFGAEQLQRAIDAAFADGTGLTEIHVEAGGNYNGFSYVINGGVENQSVVIIGGYPNCLDSSEPADGMVTVIDGLGMVNTVVNVEAGDNSLIEFHNIAITGGSGGAGGGLAIADENAVRAFNLSVHDNSGSFGGGIYVSGENTFLELHNGSDVFDNIAEFSGGGIFCDDARITLDSLTALTNNEAGINGGGFFLNNCRLNSFSSLPGGIFSNRAAIDGGGGFVSAGGFFNMIGGTAAQIGDASSPASLDNNRAGANGGGLEIRGAGSRARIRDGRVVFNTADADSSGKGRGGGIHMTSATELEIARTLPGDQCHTVDRCSLLSGNRAQIGGAVSADFDALVDIRHTYIENNTALTESSAIDMNAGDFSPGTLHLQGNVIADNESVGSFTINLKSNNLATFAYNTMARNLGTATDRVIAFDDRVDLQAHGNIWFETVGQIFTPNWSPTATATMDCSLAFETASLPPGATRVISQDPFLADPENGDFHLSDESPAIDFCDNTVFDPDADIDGMPRGGDAPTVPDLHGPFDLGADEHALQVVFASGFEA